MPRPKQRAPHSIDVAEVIGASDLVTRRNPYRKNPVDDEGNCLYTDLKDPDRHCLGGAVLLELGCELPDEHMLTSDTPNFTLFTSQALDWLDTLQGLADGDRLSDAAPGPNRPWRRAHDMAVRQYVAYVEAHQIKDTI